MSDLTQQFVLSVTGAGTAGTTYLTVPFDGDLVLVTAGANAAGTAGATTVDVTVGGTSVFATAANVAASGDAGATITSNKLQIAGDSASKVGKASSVSSLTTAATNKVTNNVTSGVDYIGPIAPADRVLASVTAGQEIAVVTTLATGTTRCNVALQFVRK